MQNHLFNFLRYVAIQLDLGETFELEIHEALRMAEIGHISDLLIPSKQDRLFNSLKALNRRRQMKAGTFSKLTRFYDGVPTIFYLLDLYLDELHPEQYERVRAYQHQEEEEIRAWNKSGDIWDQRAGSRIRPASFGGGHNYNRLLEYAAPSYPEKYSTLQKIQLRRKSRQSRRKSHLNKKKRRTRQSRRERCKKCSKCGSKLGHR
tara:strand:+ start:64 stop:678 length:615 start_codon:yes stop_codon:yes gene_type:complete